MSVWYRYVDEVDYERSGGMIICQTYPVIKRTKKGVRLHVPETGRSRIVLTASHKRFACPTLAEAFESYRRRKKVQAAILTGQLHHVKAILETLDAATFTTLSETPVIYYELPKPTPGAPDVKPHTLKET